jgi:hypothetical protein
MQSIEDECARLDEQLAAHGERSAFDHEIWNLTHDSSDNLTTPEERVTKIKALEAAIADIPMWRKQVDDEYQRVVRGLLPFCTRLLKALAARIDEEMRDISNNGAGGRSEFWGVGTDDDSWILYPLARLSDYTAAHIEMCQKYHPQNGWLLRSRLIDAGAILQKAKLDRG